jgi:hypothetical protein
MIKRSIAFVTAFGLIVAIGCSTTGPKSGSAPQPGTSGTRSAKEIEKTQHPATPEGVGCYVCHKREVPESAFHEKYGNKCEECHVKTTWMAAKYPHPGWALSGAHKARCNRCHTKMASYDFSSYQCWGCHHIQTATEKTHSGRNITDISNCIMCHKDIKLKEAAAPPAAKSAK